jgi:RNA polymerase sigma factor (sigma-70 family)
MSTQQASLFRARASISKCVVLETQNCSQSRTHSWLSESMSSDATLHSNANDREWTLVQQAIAGDQRAQEQILATHNAMLRRVALGILRNKEDAEDAVQDGLCRAYVRLRSSEGRSSFSTWLSRIVINSALMNRRRRNGHPKESMDETVESHPKRWQAGIIDVRPNPEEAYGRTEFKALVEEQMLQLAPGERAAFQILELDGLSITDSSLKLGIHTSALKSRLTRARRKLVTGLRKSIQPSSAKLSLQHKKTRREGE